MKEKPIPFKGPMVQAILDGRKTMTRRVVKGHDIGAINGEMHHRVCRADGDHLEVLPCPYGPVGRRLWVRETYCFLDRHIDGTEREDPCIVGYRADESIIRFEPEPSLIVCDKTCDYGNFNWRPSIFMPRWASRITLEVTAVRVERVQDISEDDAIAEGVCNAVRDACGSRRHGGFAVGFKSLWNSINAKRGFGWDTNCWVWVVSFRRVQ